MPTTMGPLATQLSPTGADPFEGTPYRWLRHVGSGGMGEVHLVRHAVLGREFAAKILHERYAENEQLVDRVRVEAQSLGRLEHPNVVRVSSFGRLSDGRPFFIMEALQGHTLEREVQARGRLPVVEALRYSLQLTSAIAAAHELGIIHRDIKPDNLFLHHEQDGTCVLKVLDFGVARVVPGISEASPLPLLLPTDTGIVVGTPRYVSPEAARGRRVDQRADIYGIGLVLYFMLAGRGPFDHLDDDQRVLVAHALDAPPLLATHAVEGLSEALEGLVQRAIAKDPELRFATARELETELSRLLQEAVVTAGGATTPPVPTAWQRTVPLPRVSVPAAKTEPLPAPALEPRPSARLEPASTQTSRRERRGAGLVAALFFGITLLVGLASAGAVVVLRRFLGAP